MTICTNYILPEINVTFLYRECSSLSKNHYFTNHYNFFLNALKRNSRIKVNYVLSDQNFDITKLNEKPDIIILYENANTGDDCVPEKIFGLKSSGIPVIVKLGDPWKSKTFDLKKNHEDYNIIGYFAAYPQSIFYKYYPKNYKYRTIFYGVETSQYENLTPFSERIKNKILNSGAIASKKLRNRLYCKLFKGDADPMLHYKLRTMCNDLPYVEFRETFSHDLIGDKYPLYLQKFSSAIAATTDTYTMKYFEMPAANCLTFMEVTEKNSAKILGFIDGESAIFINEKNYKEKFDEYLSDINNPKWEKIASRGRIHALETFSNDRGVNSLVDYIEDLI